MWKFLDSNVFHSTIKSRNLGIGNELHRSTGARKISVRKVLHEASSTRRIYFKNEGFTEPPRHPSETTIECLSGDSALSSHPAIPPCSLLTKSIDLPTDRIIGWNDREGIPQTVFGARPLDSFAPTFLADNNDQPIGKKPYRARKERESVDERGYIV